MSDTFGGVKQYNVMCKECGYESITYEKFLTVCHLSCHRAKRVEMPRLMVRR